MTPGQLARRILGPAFPIAGEAYRRVFVDMPRVVDAMLPHIPKDANILDIGGGDGYAVNLVLDRRPDVTVTMTDLAPSIGSFVTATNRPRVSFRPSTDASEIGGTFDVISIFDVLHHVPVSSRPAFLEKVADTGRRIGARTVAVKDIRPGSLRALAAAWGDIYITGDRSISQLPESEVSLPGYKLLLRAMPDFPNYLMIFENEKCTPTEPNSHG